jgi:hypothetical protein
MTGMVDDGGTRVGELVNPPLMIDPVRDIADPGGIWEDGFDTSMPPHG